MISRAKAGVSIAAAGRGFRLVSFRVSCSALLIVFTLETIGFQFGMLDPASIYIMTETTAMIAVWSVSLSSCAALTLSCYIAILSTVECSHRLS